MKKVIAIIGVFTLSCLSVLAYTPSTSLVGKMDVVVDKFEEIIDSKWESYRTNILSAISSFKAQYSSDERISYILDYLTTELTVTSTDTTSVASAWSADYTGEYTISDSNYGTEVEVTIADGVRTIISNALPNHETGQFPTVGNPNTISEQDKEWTLTTTPTYLGNETWARESGVAYNGVKYELETAERVTCTSGETYRIEAQQSMFNLGLDFNNAHVQPTGEYHYHGVADVLVDNLEGDDVVHVGYANDGFPIYYSKLGTYTPSYTLSTDEREGTSCTYEARTTTDVVIEGTTPDGTYDLDWEFNQDLGNLDACNGAYVDWEYGYFITEDFPYGPRCMNGDYTMWGGGQGGWAPAWQGGQGGWPQWGLPPRQ